MNVRRVTRAGLLAALMAWGAAAGGDLADVRAQFAAPDARSGVNCWWWWLNGHTDTDVLDRELRAMKERHFQGAMIFDAGGAEQRGNRAVPAGPTFGSPAWCDLFVHALDAAERLGLEMGVNIQSGWNLGGPSVTPADAAKTLVCTERTFAGGDTVSLPPQPRARHGFYRDLAVLAFPVDDRHVADAPIHFLAEKLGARELGFSAADCRFLLTNDAADKSSAGRKPPFIVRRDAIMDLTSRLPWTAPDGTWVVMRIGYTCTDATISTASAGWTGRVLDYMSSAALDRYWQTVVEPILARAGHHVGTTLTHLETDSWECGGMNWTLGFEATFRALNGYDPIPHLAVLGGYVVDDMDATHAFLADFRKTVAETICRNHYGHFAELAHARGLGIQPESAGPHTGPLDGLKNYAQSDIVMSEFWSPSPHRATPPSRYFVKQAASAAHLYGQRIVGAESFTTIGPHWSDCLWRDQKSAFDHEICSGLNRVYLHTFTSSPDGMGLPGQEYFAGTHINPRVTWWDESAVFFDYLRRVQSVVQNGRFVADAVYYYGDHVPNIYPLKEADLPGVLPGFDYDVADERALGALTVDATDGRLIGPHGTAYRLLVLPNRIRREKPQTGPDGRVVCENREKVPVVLMLNFRGNHAILDDPEVPLPECPGPFCVHGGGENAPQESFRAFGGDTRSRTTVPAGFLVARGYALLTACYQQISPDASPSGEFGEKTAYTGVFDLWGERDPGRDDDVTSLGAWAWALSRGLDLAETIPEIDAGRCVATGSSSVSMSLSS